MDLQGEVVFAVPIIELDVEPMLLARDHHPFSLGAPIAHHRMPRSENVARQTSGSGVDHPGEHPQDLGHPAEPALGVPVGDRQLLRPRRSREPTTLTEGIAPMTRGSATPASRNSPSQTGWTGICKIRENWSPFQG